MSLTKLNCPECGTVMRPKVPVAPGKKVKCPKCETVFKAPAPDDVDDVDEIEVLDDAPAKKKKPTVKAAARAKPEPAKKKDEEEEETYGYVKEEEDDEDAKERKKINYAPDESVKDMRGPAIIKLRMPTGYLTLCGFIGAGGWIVWCVLLIIPFAFPLFDEGPHTVYKVGAGLADVNPANQSSGGFFGGGGGDQGKKVTPSKPFFLFWGFDFGRIVNLPSLEFWAAMLPFFLMALYSGLVSFGAIKLINLESRVWGIVSSIMAMLPLNTLGASWVLILVIQWGLRQIELEEDFIFYVGLGETILLYLASLGLGIWTLVVALDPVVKEGFEYDPE